MNNFLRLFLVSYMLAAVCLFASEPQQNPPASPQNFEHISASGAVHHPAVTADTVRAVVVKSWYSSGGDLIWEDMNQNWMNYGSTPIRIDHTTLSDVSAFTYQDLVNTGADVLILSDPLGGSKPYTRDEATAVQTYAN